MTTDRPIILSMRCVAFSREGAARHTIKVDGDRVLVFDAIAQHYTMAHSLSASALRRAKAAARKLAAGKCDESAECYFA